MAYVGRPPSNAPLTTVDIPDGIIVAADLAPDSVDSSELVDGSIDTAHIADNQVTLAKMAGGTDGQIITYDASGDPVAVGPGTDGQVLTSTGAGSPPAFEAIVHSVKQVRHTSVATENSIGTSYEDTGLAHSIVPTSNLNDVLVAFQIPYYTSDERLRFKIQKQVDSGGYADISASESTFWFGVNSAIGHAAMYVQLWKDAPGSGTTWYYKLQAKINTGGDYHVGQVCPSNSTADVWIFELAIS